MKLKIQPPGDSYFFPLLLRSPRLLQYLGSEEAAAASDGELLLVRLYESVFSYGIHRLYQEKWDNSYRNPVGQAFYRDGKPFCELLRSFLEAAEYVFCMSTKWAAPTFWSGFSPLLSNFGICI